MLQAVAELVQVHPQRGALSDPPEGDAQCGANDFQYGTASAAADGCRSKRSQKKREREVAVPTKGVAASALDLKLKTVACEVEHEAIPTGSRATSGKQGLEDVAGKDEVMVVEM